jgi:hypothetical protein
MPSIKEIIREFLNSNIIVIEVIIGNKGEKTRL